MKNYLKQPLSTEEARMTRAFIKDLADGKTTALVKGKRPRPRVKMVEDPDDPTAEFNVVVTLPGIQVTAMAFSGTDYDKVTFNVSQGGRPKKGNMVSVFECLELADHVARERLAEINKEKKGGRK